MEFTSWLSTYIGRMIIMEMKLGPEVIIIPIAIAMVAIAGLIHIIIRAYQGKKHPVESTLGMFLTGILGSFVSYVCWPSLFYDDNISPMEVLVVFTLLIQSVVYFIFFLKSSAFK